MSKELTPMKRYQDGLNTLRSYLSPAFTELTLNKVQSKTAWVHGEYHKTKGVENDFVLVFKSPFPDISIGLVFNFLDLPKEQHTVQATIKKGKDNSNIQLSEPMDLATFKTTLNEFNTWAAGLRNQKKEIKPVAVLNKFSETFLKEVVDYQQELKTQAQKFQEFLAIKEEQFGIPKLVKDAKKAKTHLEEVEGFIKKEIETSDAYKEMVLLQEKLKKLEKTVTTTRSKLEKELNLKTLQQVAWNTEHKLKITQQQLEHSIETEYKGAAIKRKM